MKREHEKDIYGNDIITYPLKTAKRGTLAMIESWITADPAKRVDFIDFCREVALQYGMSTREIRGLIEEFYPSITIEGGQPVVNKKKN